MGLYEGSQEILACPRDYHVAFVRCFDRVIVGFSCGTIYLHPVLTDYSVWNQLKSALSVAIIILKYPAGIALIHAMREQDRSIDLLRVVF